jgi:hypothetical protein
VSTTDKGEVLVRSLTDGTVIQRLPVQDEPIGAVAYSPDGKTLALATLPVHGDAQSGICDTIRGRATASENWTGARCQPLL